MSQTKKLIESIQTNLNEEAKDIYLTGHQRFNSIEDAYNFYGDDKVYYNCYHCNKVVTFNNIHEFKAWLEDMEGAPISDEEFLNDNLNTHYSLICDKCAE